MQCNIFQNHDFQSAHSEYPLLLWQEILELSCRFRDRTFFHKIIKALLNSCLKFHLFLSSFDVFTGTVQELIDYAS